MNRIDLHDDHTMPAHSFAEATAYEAAIHVITYQSGTQLRQVTVGRAPLIVGRSAPASFQIESARVSRQHCRLQVVDDTLTVTDLGSTNGTFVDGHRVATSACVHHGSTIALGSEVLTYERMSWRDLQSARASERDRDSAIAYLQDLLPEPLTAGPVRAQWLFLPSSKLGGTGFGYRFLRPDLLAGFFVEVAGSGTRASMHAVALMSFLRQQDAPGFDFADCAGVLRSLEAAFPAKTNGGQFFSASYFTVELATRTLHYAACGRGPVLLSGEAACDPVRLPSRGGPIGLGERGGVKPLTTLLPPGARLLFVSDAALELLEAGGHDVAGMLQTTEPAHLPAVLHGALNEAGEPHFDNDFVALVFNIP